MNSSHDDIIVGGEGSKSFFSYMFSLTSTEKNDLLNMVQYVILAIIPIIIILKLMKKYFPAENDKKASIEILIEVVVQLIVIFAFFWFIHKLILFIPTYSSAPYPSFNIIQIIIPVIFILFSMNSTISEKATILLQRALVALGIVKENCEDAEQKKPNPNVAVIPPSLMPMVSNMEATRGVPSYDMRQEQNQNTFQPGGYGQQGGYGIQEPTAANELCGGSMY